MAITSLQLETNRLILRPIQPQDFDAFAAMNADPRVMAFFPSTMTPEETRASMERIEKQKTQYGFERLAITLKEDNKFIGFVGILALESIFPFAPGVEIGWRLAYPYWNKGYATEGAKAVLADAFNRLQLSEIVAFTFRENKPSERIMQKLGMTHNIQDDFEHPKYLKNHPLSPHVLYRLSSKTYRMLEKSHFYD